MTRIIFIATLLPALALAEGAQEIAVSVSGTSARTASDIGPGWKAIQCDVAVFFRTGTSTATAVTTDMPIPSNTARQVYIGNVEKRLAFITSGSSGTCRIYALQVDPSGNPPEVATGANGDITPSSVVASGDITAGDDLTIADVSDLKGTIKNTEGTEAVRIDDAHGFEWTDGAGTVVGVASTTGLISGDVGISSGAFSVMWVGGGAVPEGSDGQGFFFPITIGRGSDFGWVSCGCRTAGSGGTNGVFLALMEDGLSAIEVELTGADSNACNETKFRARLDTAISAEAEYALQFTSSTDCAGNPVDCLCNVEVTR